MIYIESNSFDPYFNLALEEYVFERMNRSQDYFRLWQNHNTIVVGKFQNTYEEINARFAEEQGIRVVRRLSGGGAVYHDRGNLNFTFIVNSDLKRGFDFSRFLRPIVATLAQLGVKAEFNSRNDLTIDGRKFSGNAQYIKNGRLLHHGTLMLDSDLEVVAQALRVSADKLSSNSSKSVRSRVGTIREHLPQLTMDQFKQALLDQIFASGDFSSYQLSAADLAAVEQLRQEKYATWEWNYGRSPRFDLQKDRRFAGGSVSVRMNVEQGLISDIRLFGDFFGNGDLSELEALLRGAELNQSLLSRLEQADISRYINDVTPRQLFELICY